MTVERWALIHSYRSLVSAGGASPILCPDCQEEYITGMGKNEEPVFRCLSCKSVVTPGLAIWSQIEEVLGV